MSKWKILKKLAGYIYFRVKWNTGEKQLNILIRKWVKRDVNFLRFYMLFPEEVNSKAKMMVQVRKEEKEKAVLSEQVNPVQSA